MARMPRLVIPGQPLHIVQRGNNRQPVFFADEDYRYYLDTLRAVGERFGCAIHAYVLMTNHVHLLMTPAAEDSPSRCLQALGRKYVRYINGAYRRTGTLWEGRYKSALIDSESYLLTCHRYLELNPVRANMVTGPGQYLWSSYRHNALGQSDPTLTPHARYLGLGSGKAARLAAYRGLFEGHVDNESLTVIREATENSTIMGSETFKEEISAMLNRRVTKCSHGGDRKSEVFRER